MKGESVSHSVISDSLPPHEKGGLKLNIQKIKIMSSGPTTSWEIGKQWLTLFWGPPKSLQMVIAVMKLKDTYSLEGKL